MDSEKIILWPLFSLSSIEGYSLIIGNLGTSKSSPEEGVHQNNTSGKAREPLLVPFGVANRASVCLKEAVTEVNPDRPQMVKLQSLTPFKMSPP